MAIDSVHQTDIDGNPAGGLTTGIGFSIDWQNGPLCVDGVRLRQSGAFVEEVIEAAVDRIEYYQSGKFACEANAAALGFLKLALLQLNERTKDREKRGVEGTHED